MTRGLGACPPAVRAVHPQGRSEVPTLRRDASVVLARDACEGTSHLPTAEISPASLAGARRVPPATRGEPARWCRTSHLLLVASRHPSLRKRGTGGRCGYVGVSCHETGRQGEATSQGTGVRPACNRKLSAAPQKQTWVIEARNYAPRGCDSPGHTRPIHTHPRAPCLRGRGPKWTMLGRH